MRQWAAFGESVPSFPLLFSCLYAIPDPGWDDLQAQLAWQRYAGKQWPSEDEIRRLAKEQGTTLPDVNRHWNAIYGVAGPSLCSLAFPKSTLSSVVSESESSPSICGASSTLSKGPTSFATRCQSFSDVSLTLSTGAVFDSIVG